MESTKIDYLKEITTLDGAVPFLKDIWNFFNTKGMKTVVVSLNSLDSFNIDLELTESLGCPIHLLLDNHDCENRWAILQKTLKVLKLFIEIITVFIPFVLKKFQISFKKGISPSKDDIVFKKSICAKEFSSQYFFIQFQEYSIFFVLRFLANIHRF